VVFETQANPAIEGGVCLFSSGLVLLMLDFPTDGAVQAPEGGMGIPSMLNLEQKKSSLPARTFFVPVARQWPLFG
jgi:hypothetical protein